MNRARILSPWQAAGGAFMPQLAADYTLVRWVDAAHQPAGNLPPAPNLTALDVVVADAVLAAIEADARYQVLWSELV